MLVSPKQPGMITPGTSRRAAHDGDAPTIARWLLSVRITRSNYARAVAMTAGRIAAGAKRRRILKMLMDARADASDSSDVGRWQNF